MKRKAKVTHKRRVISRKVKPRKLHHKVISFFKGDGGIYVIFILATAMAGSFALTGGILPNLNPAPPASSEVTIDPDSANQSSESALQLVDLKVKPPTPTPTLTLTPSPTRGLTITPPPPDACLDKTVIALMLDVSTSMRSNDKIGRLNTAMGNFVKKLKDETVVGAVQFAGLASFDNGSETLLPFTKYSDNKNLVTSRLTNLSVQTNSANDGTYMRSAFNRMNGNIDSVKKKYEDLGYKFVAIFFSDGVPETQFTDNNCVVRYDNPYLCFARVQDPRSTSANSVDLTERLEDKVEKVYAVGLYTGARELQALSAARDLLEDIASQPSYARSSSNTNQLNQLFEDSISSVCN